MSRFVFVSAVALALLGLVAGSRAADPRAVTAWPDDIQARLQSVAGPGAGVAAMVLKQGRIIGSGLQRPVSMPAGPVLALAVLQRVPARALAGDAGLRRQLAAALHGDVHGGTWPLCARAGGPQAVERTLQDLGIGGVRVLGTGCARVRATPLALVTLLDRIDHGAALAAPARRWLTARLQHAATPADGGWWLRADLGGQRSGIGVVTLPDGRRLALVISTDLHQPQRFARTLHALWQAGLGPQQRVALAATD